ncbi:MAG TPA: C25 family cysteine peptidase, partial [Vicinamibacterales bacterium]
NGLRMHLLCAASCDVGKFNDPTVQSLGERMVVTPTNGAIAVVSATEEAFSGQNAQLNRFFYAHLFQRDTLDSGQAGGDILPGIGQYHLAISSALLAAKIDAAFSETNNSKYQVMGDAATRLNLPRLWAEVSLFDAAGAPITQLARGQTVTFRGQVLDGPGGSPLPYDGVASLLVEDSAPLDRTPVACSGFGTTTYLYKPGPIYHGDVSAAAGAFEGRFVVPMDATLGIRGRMRTYLQGTSGSAPGDVDGAGAFVTELIAGTAPSTDVQGPTLTLSFLGGATAVRPDATLQINLYDDSGIMTTGHALQNSIVVTLDDNTTSRVDVTSSFRYAADSYQSGTASYQLQNLPKGHHKVSVSAADNLATGFSAAQHRSSATLEFDVVDQADLAIDRAYLFPNPASSGGPGSGGTFVIDAPGDSVNTLLRIYTLSGRLIRQFRAMGGLGQVQIPWDGRDGDGDPLANGTYLFKVFVYSREADGGSSASEKAVTQGRFSILNR